MNSYLYVKKIYGDKADKLKLKLPIIVHCNVCMDAFWNWFLLTGFNNWFLVVYDFAGVRPVIDTP